MRHLTNLNALISVSASVAVASPSAEQWAERSIYQMMTDRFARPAGSPDESCDPYRYCGGSWAGLLTMVENIADNTVYGEAYHSYWPQNMYALNEHFGTADELRNLSKELHKRGMYLMVDVVINDMAQAVNSSIDSGSNINWSRLIPFDDKKYYHPFCGIEDWNNPDESKNCWFSTEVVALPDLKTEDESVVSMIQVWVKGLVGNYSIDGLRVDATEHMNEAYLTSFNEAAGDPDAVCKYEEVVSGLLNYPLYGPMVQAFTAGNMSGLAEKIRAVHSQCKDFTRLATFTENHDTPRFASLINDTTLAKNAMAFNILSEGIPIVYQGQEQHMKGQYAPYNREPLWRTSYNRDGSLYKTTSTLNRLRNNAIRLDKHYVSSHSEELFLDVSTYATRKGTEGSQIVSIFSNQGSQGGPYNLSIPGAYKPGTEVIEVLGCKRVTADHEGQIVVKMDKGEPKAFFSVRKMNGSGLCGFKGRRGKKGAICPSAGKGNGTRRNDTIEEGTVEQTSAGNGASMTVPMIL
ncbi:hypothetical protein BDW72DRAFT_209457 [Aspergillus terricola var. indicus]